VACPVDDVYFTDEQKMRRERTLIGARADHVTETYHGAHHGFAVSDLTSIDRFVSERHRAALFRLFRESFALER
jgi:dienelactone hydrolase